MAINSATDLRNTDAGQTAFTVRQNPVGGSTPCHAVQVTQAATSGAGAGVNVVSNNTESAAIQTRAAGPLLDLRDASSISRFKIENDGTVTYSGSGFVQVKAPTGVAATDMANINAALALVPSGGGVVQLQAGTYVLPAPAAAASGCVSLSTNGTTLQGAGMGVTTLKVADGTSASITGIVRTPSGVVNSHITVRDLTIDGNKANKSGTPTIIGFYCGVSPNGTATDTDISLERVEIKNCTDYGADPHERTTRFRAYGCLFHDNDVDGLTLDACYDSDVVACYSYSNGRHGFNVVTASTRVRLVDCHAYSNTVNGLILQTGAKDNVIAASSFYSNAGSGVVINGVAQSGQQDNNPGRNNSVANCSIQSNSLHGIQLVGASYNRISGNSIRDSSQAATNTSDQIRLQSSGSDHCTFNHITDNDINVTAGVTNAPKYGIREDTSSQNGNYVFGNRSQGAVTAQISLQGATSLLLAGHNGTGHPIDPYSPDVPSLHGYDEWNWAPDLSGASAGVIMIAGTVYGMRVDAQSGNQISNIIINIGTTGTSMTANQCFASVINGETGAELARTADIATLLQGSGVTTLPLASSFTATAGTKLAVMLLANSSGTMPQLVRSSSTSATGPNAGLSSTSPRRYFTAGTTQTSLASSFTMSSTTATGALTFWVALT